MSDRELKVRQSTLISGVYHIELPIFEDTRGYFKENYQQQKLQQLGLPPFNIVQQNISFNASSGVTRGIHCEPWNKYSSVACGRVFVAIVDVRAGDNFGQTECFELDPSRAVYLPVGVGNSFQSLVPNTIYNYLVNDHWSADAQYQMINLADKTLAIEWPIALEKAIISDKDRAHPPLSELHPFREDG